MLNSKFCHWYEDTHRVWHTDCHEAFVLDTEDPSRNKMRFCCYCGRTLLEVKYKKDEANRAAL